MEQYEINGSTYPRVSTILGLLDKPWMAQWVANLTVEYFAKEIPELFFTDELVRNKCLKETLEEAKTAYKKESEKALSIGSEVHKAIEKYIEAKIVFKNYPEPWSTDWIEFEKRYGKSVTKGFRAFLEWEKGNVVNWLKSEVTIHEPELCYAGTADAIAEMKNGKVYIIDFKTSKAHYPEHELQLAAYHHCYQLNFNCIVDGALILRLDKMTGEPYPKDVTKKLPQKLKAFHNLVDYYYNSANRRVKNVRTKRS